MKLTLTLHDNIYTVDTPDDGIDINQVAEHIKGLLVAAGYHPTNVDQIFNTECQWFNDNQDNHPFLTKNTSQGL